MGCAVTDRLRFVNVQRGRDGVVRHWYFRRNGRRWRLPGNPYSDANARAEYTRLEQETNKESAPAAGTAIGMPRDRLVRWCGTIWPRARSERRNLPRRLSIVA